MYHELHSGPFDQIPTLFIHGNLASGRWWDLVLPHLSATCPAITADWCGYGKTPGSENVEDLHPRKLASDFLDLLKELGVEKANLAGHSVGGLISLYCLLDAPDLFNKALLLNPVSPRGLTVEQEKYDAFALMQKDRRVLELVLETTIHKVDTSTQVFQSFVDESAKAHTNNWQSVPRHLSEINIVEELKSINHPVHILHGDHDVVLDINESKFLAGNLKNGSFEELKNHGHSPNIECPELVAERIKSEFYI